MSPLQFEFAVRTDLGRRVNNEDRAFASERLAVVADGVGGAAAGEVASRLAVERMIELDKRRLLAPLEDELRDAVAGANQAIGFTVDCRPDHAGMATTITTVALTNDGEYLVLNVGDSRTYLRRDGELRQLTRDDSLVQALVDYGELTPEEARGHPQRSVVTAVLGGQARLALEVLRLAGRAGDRLLLCSDGVSDAIDDAEISRTLEIADRDRCAQELIDRALAAGGRDNITAVVADVVEHDGSAAGWLQAL